MLPAKQRCEDRGLPRLWGERLAAEIALNVTKELRPAVHGQPGGMCVEAILIAACLVSAVAARKDEALELFNSFLRPSNWFCGCGHCAFLNSASAFGFACPPIFIPTRDDGDRPKSEPNWRIACFAARRWRSAGLPTKPPVAPGTSKPCFFTASFAAWKSS